MKKETYFLASTLIVFISSTIQFVNAQSCSGDDVLMSTGCACGFKKSECQSQCVKPNRVQSLLKRGWYFGECVWDCCGTIKAKKEQTVTQLAASENLPKEKSFHCNCFLPDYGCKKNEKCLSFCYRACELGWIVYSDRSSHSTTISLSLSKPERLSLEITDQVGRPLKTFKEKQIEEGLHDIVWNEKDELGNAVSSGVYVVQLNVNSYSQMKKVTIIK